MENLNLPEGVQMLIFPLLIFVGFYVLLFMPQKRQRKAHFNMINSLKEGDRVVTIGGLHGVIVGVDDQTIALRAGDKVKLTFERSAIRSIEQPDADKA